MANSPLLSAGTFVQREQIKSGGYVLLVVNRGEPDEEIDFKITSDGRYSCHVIWYGGERRPGRSGSRVVRGTNSFS